MEKLTGYGIPHNHLAGEVGQYYEDLNTGDLYECRSAHKYSPLHGAPVGGYVWVLRATGEDISELYGSGGGSWNDLKDKPFYEETKTVAGDTLYWDGNTEGRARFGDLFYKVSDAVPSVDDLVEGTTVTANVGVTLPLTQSFPVDGYLILYFENEPIFVVIPDDLVGSNIDGEIVTESGMYAYNNDSVYPISFTIPGYNGFKTTTTELKTLESKFLPEALHFGEDKAFEPIVWDGNTEGLEVFTGNNGTFYKIADYVPVDSAEQVDSVVVTATNNGESAEIELISTMWNNAFSAQDHIWVFGNFGLFGTDGQYGQGGVTIPAGVYTKSVVDAFGAPLEGFSMIVNPASAVTPMNEKYFPILTSPSGKKFKITIADDGTITSTEVT